VLAHRWILLEKINHFGFHLLVLGIWGCLFLSFQLIAAGSLVFWQ
jgi:hypothetical protein